ncbi:hypothetical protein ACN9M0_36090 [Streptomyces sp. R-07]|uniref:hypothetical protein n=1 Tax=unclassified Streptomyces TaxID=2593676 RepID=UPI0034285B90
MVLLGEAGQGKTHLLVDATRRALEQGRPSLTIFAEQLSAVDPLTQIAQQLGLGALPHEVLLQAMDAAGAASDARFTLFIDALNDQRRPDCPRHAGSAQRRSRAGEGIGCLAGRIGIAGVAGRRLGQPHRRRHRPPAGDHWP